MNNLKTEWLLSCLHEIANADEENIEGDNIDVYGETSDGLEVVTSIKITETACKAIEEIKALKHDNEKLEAELKALKDAPISDIEETSFNASEDFGW